MFHGAANNALLALRLAGDGMPYVVRRARRMALGSWLLRYAADPKMAPLMALVLRQKALGTAMLRAAITALVTMACA